jgi:hypothetical protein
LDDFHSQQVMSNAWMGAILDIATDANSNSVGVAIAKKRALFLNV